MDDTLTHFGLLDDEEIALDEAALWLASLDHPDIDTDPYEDILEAMVARLAEAGAEAESGQERAAILSQIVAGEFGFVGDRDTYDHPDNADLIRVVDRRRGLPVSLSILYVSAARRIGWIADALDVPGHVLVLVGDDVAPVIIDPFGGGTVIGPEQLAALLAAVPGPETPAVRHVATMPNRAILVRLLLNQATRAEAVGKGRRALTLYERMTSIAPDHGHGWWERARLELIDGDIGAARASLSAMLETTRDPEIRARVTGTLSALAGA